MAHEAFYATAAQVIPVLGLVLALEARKVAGSGAYQDVYDAWLKNGAQRVAAYGVGAAECACLVALGFGYDWRALRVAVAAAVAVELVAAIRYARRLRPAYLDEDAPSLAEQIVWALREQRGPSADQDV